QKSPGDVHLMDALIAEIAVAGIPDPMPVVVELLAPQREFFGGGAPEGILDRLRQRLFSGSLADARTAFIAEPASVLNLAERFIFQPFQRGVQSRPGAALHAHLNDLLMRIRGFDELAAFPHIV